MKQSAIVKENSKNDICFAVYMAMLWSNTILMRFFRVVLMSIPYICQHADLIISVAFFSFFLLSISSVIREIRVKELLIVLAFYGVFYLYYCIFPLNEYYYENNQDLVVKETLPMFLVGILSFRIDRKRILKILNQISMATILAYAAYMALYQTMSESTLSGGDMHAAYMLLPHLCLVFYTMVAKANVWKISTFPIGVVCLLLLGNRGSILCLSVFIVFTVLFSGRLKRPVLFLVLSTMFLIALFAFGFLEFLYDFAEQNGFSLRIFEKLESGELTDSTGRDKIMSKVVEYIQLYPMMGMGIFADRRIAGGLYAHNIILEIILHYGIVLGILILGIILYFVIAAFKYLRKKKDVMTLGFFSALIFSYVVKLLLSSSYLVEPYFFFTMGFAYAAVREQKEDRIAENRTTKCRKTLERAEVKVNEKQTENLCDRYQFSMVRSSCSETD